MAPNKTSFEKTLPCGRKVPQINASKNWESQFSEYVSQKQLRQSAPRQMIAELIMQSPGHFKAQDIVQLALKKDASIGAATVYRTLALLHDAGLLNQTLIDEGGTTIYERADGDDHHDHIVCLDCGHILEFHDERIEKIQRTVNSKLSFREVRHRHVIYAHCELNEIGG